MSTPKSKPESFHQRASHVVGQPCWVLNVSNYGENKTSWKFFTRSENYAEVKKNVILKLSPEAIVEIEPGVIDFKLYKRAE
jgi:hypothetical protein